jgi:RNA polymerase sigma factor (sigma-70 family)
MMPETAVMMDEPHLVRDALAGDREAFEEIVRRFVSPVEATAYAITGDPDKSEDITQEAFVAAWQRLRQLEHPEKLRAWLCAIARNIARQSLRSAPRDPLHATIALDSAPESATVADLPSAAEVAMEKERRRLAWQAIEGIPEDYRLPLVLYYREGQSVREVAAALDLSEDTVRQRLSRARGMVRTEVSRMVEVTLQSTRPAPMLVGAVMAAVAAAASPAAAAGTVALAVAKGTTGAAGTAMAGILGGLLGPVIGVAGGWWSYRQSLRNARTPEERRILQRLANLTLILIAVWVVLIGLVTVLGVRGVISLKVAFVLAALLLVAYLGLLTWLTVRWTQCTRAADASDAAQPDKRSRWERQAEYARAHPREWRINSAVSYAGGVFGGLGWLVIHAGMSGQTALLWTTLAFSAALTACGVWANSKHPEGALKHTGMFIAAVAVYLMAAGLAVAEPDASGGWYLAVAPPVAVGIILLAVGIGMVAAHARRSRGGI